MMKLVGLIVGGLVSVMGVQGEEGVRRLLYMSMPDGAQKEVRSGSGILVFDIDDGHKLVKRIAVKHFDEGLRGFTGSAVTGCVYYGTTNRRLGCFDLETEQVVWDKQYDRGCDRSCITMDGKTVYAPTGWWHQGEDGGFLVVDAATGEKRKTMVVGKTAHNSIASLDGRFVYLGTQTRLTQFSAVDGKVLQEIEPVGEAGVFPYTVNSANTLAFVCLGKHVGFDVVDLTTGKVRHRVFADGGEGKIQHRTHGAGLTPDESELWISDQAGKKLFIFDATVMPPAAKGHVELSVGGHGWVTFSLDGAYAYCHTPDIFDARTKEKVGTFRDEKGEPVGSSKFIEVHMDGNGKVVGMGNEFGLGRKEGEAGR